MNSHLVATGPLVEPSETKYHGKFKNSAAVEGKDVELAII
jgi:hypothetical protein